MDENKVTDWIKGLIDNDSYQVESIKNLKESLEMMHAMIDHLSRRLDKLEQKSSISYLKPLNPQEGPF